MTIMQTRNRTLTKAMFVTAVALTFLFAAALAFADQAPDPLFRVSTQQPPACTTCKDGAPGRDGIDGQDGRDGVDGRDGEDGIDGKDGKDGAPGTCEGQCPTPPSVPYPYPPHIDYGVPAEFRLVGAIAMNTGVNNELYYRAPVFRGRQVVRPGAFAVIHNQPSVGVPYPGRPCYQIREQDHVHHVVKWDELMALTSSPAKPLVLSFRDIDEERNAAGQVVGVKCNVTWVMSLPCTPQ